MCWRNLLLRVDSFFLTSANDWLEKDVLIIHLKEILWDYLFTFFITYFDCSWVLNPTLFPGILWNPQVIFFIILYNVNSYNCRYSQYILFVLFIVLNTKKTYEIKLVHINEWFNFNESWIYSYEIPGNLRNDKN